MNLTDAARARTRQDVSHWLRRRARWAFAAGGIALAVFGIVAVVQPQKFLPLMSPSFLVVVALDGALLAIVARHHQHEPAGWSLLLMGLLGLGIGAIGLFHSPLGLRRLVLLFSSLSSAQGVLLSLLAYRARHSIGREWALYMAGALSLSLGVLAVAQPVSGRLSHLWLIAVWCICVGGLRSLAAVSFGRGREHRPMRRSQ